MLHLQFKIQALSLHSLLTLLVDKTKYLTTA